MNKNNVEESECDEWAKAVYYMCDLNHFDKDKSDYKNFLENKRCLKVID